MQMEGLLIFLRNSSSNSAIKNPYIHMYLIANQLRMNGINDEQGVQL
jgi:hypothetical protein